MATPPISPKAPKSPSKAPKAPFVGPLPSPPGMTEEKANRAQAQSNKEAQEMRRKKVNEKYMLRTGVI